MPTYDLGLEHVSLAFATKNIFTDVTQGVFEGDRIGIVGRNGDGKSTLLHLFKGTQEPDSGRVTMRNGLTFGMLDQRDPLDDNATVREAALEGREDYEWAAETKSREIVEALLGGISLEIPGAQCDAILRSVSGRLLTDGVSIVNGAPSVRVTTASGNLTIRRISPEKLTENE